MKLIEIMRIVLLNLFQNKFKVILTSLGIIVGTTTIVMVIAIGRGGEAEVAKQFSDLSVETIYVNLDHNRTLGVDSKKIEKLTPDIMDQILMENKALAGIYLIDQTYEEISIGGSQEFVAIAGVTDGYESVSNLTLKTGDHIGIEDVEDNSFVAVIGDTLAKKFFGSAENALDENVKLGNYRYKVIGVLERKGDGIQGLNPDDTIFIPYSTAKKNLLNDHSVPQAIGLATDLNSVEKAIKNIKSTLNYVLDDSTFYMVDDAGSRIEAASQSAKTMKLLLVSIATIVFIVGGIGIMNVLFLSVKERTKEIGILKAMGSPKKEILLQFIIESTSISLLGGVLGLVVSDLIMPFMHYTSIAILPSLEGKVIALLFALITGSLFGIYPAYKAAQLKPVEALAVE